MMSGVLDLEQPNRVVWMLIISVSRVVSKLISVSRVDTNERTNERRLCSEDAHTTNSYQM